MAGKNEAVHFDCLCGNLAHTIRFQIDEHGRGDMPIMYACNTLSPWLGFWGRLREAIKYLFKPSRFFIHSDHWIMNPDDVGRLKVIATEYEERMKAWEAE